MNTRTPIKVIKRDQRKTVENTPEENSAAKKTTQQSAREMVATVTEWVNEFQQRRRTETARAFNTLLPKTAPQTGDI